MSHSAEDLEQRINDVRKELRRAVASADRSRARVLRAELRRAERDWEDALARLEEQAWPGGQKGLGARAASRGKSLPPGPPPGLLPIREQVHQALTMLGVPAAPRLIIAVHQAFFAGALVSARLTSLRRDEERSFRAAPYARPYYLCAALTADLLAPARGLLAVSTWPMDSRVIGPLSPRVDYLKAAIRVAEGVMRVASPGTGAVRLLRRFAVNIPGAAVGGGAVEPGIVAQAARAELAVHADNDHEHRAAAARRARSQLDDAGQLFGSRMRGASSRYAAGGENAAGAW